MADQFSDSAGQSLLVELRDIFQNKPVFQTRDRSIVFVCGGPTKHSAKSMRKRFITWSKTNLPGILPVLAEDAYKPTDFYDSPTTIDLAEFETIICDVADCVIVFPESVGSYAEVGYFAAKDLISKKILIANGWALQADDSFLNLGPIRKINRESFLEPTIQLPKLCKDFSPVRARLRRLTEGKKRRRFKYQPYWEMGYREKFLATLQLVSLLQPIDLEGLNTCFTTIFGATKPQEIGHVVAILHATGYVTSQVDFFTMPNTVQPLLEISGVEIGKMRSRVLLYYKKHQPEVMTLLTGR